MSPFQDPVHNDYAAQNLHGAHGYADTAYHAHQPAPYHSEASQNDYYHHQTHQAGYWPNDPHQSDLGQQNPLQSEFHDKAHHGASHRASDPFTDQNAIPLQPQTHPSSVPQNAKHLDKKKKKKLPVPWVVYTLTVVQIIVFIAELGVNSKRATSIAKPFGADLLSQLASHTPLLPSSPPSTSCWARLRSCSSTWAHGTRLACTTLRA